MRRLVPIPEDAAVSIDFEGEPIPAREGEPVAVALLAAGQGVLARSVKYHRPRGAFCLDAACSQCLMRVDGTPNLFSCRVAARAGMRLQRQNSYPSAKVDVFHAIDWLFPGGLDHHAMFAGVPVADKVMAKVARHLAGLGLLPDEVAPPRAGPETLSTAVAIAGGGAAGLAAARVLTEAAVPFVLLEREESLGGRWRMGAEAAPAEESLRLPKGSGTVRLCTTVLGLYTSGEGRFLACVSTGEEGPRLVLVHAPRFLLALGGHSPLLPFEDNDLPGVLSGRAASDLIRRRGVLPGEAPAVVGHGPEFPALVKLLEASGARPALVLDTGPAPAEGVLSGKVLKAHGRTWVTALTVQLSSGKRKKVACDSVLLSVPQAPAYEVARHAGARVVFRPASGLFVVEADADGKTRAKGVYVAGTALGLSSASASAESGQRAARALSFEVKS
jgi:sarcosine oxidase, subunit alpha